jgi:hypothetical protein
MVDQGYRLMPRYQVTSPDGKTFEVTAPDGATEDQVLQYARSQFEMAPQQSQPAKPAPPVRNQEGRVSAPYMHIRGATAGLLDYPMAGISYGMDAIQKAIPGGGNPEPNFERSLRGVRGDVEQFREDSPVQAYGAEIGGAVQSPLFRGAGRLVDKGVNAVTRASPRAAQFMAGAGRYVTGGLQGGTQGAIAGAGNAQNEMGGVPTVRDVAKSTGIMTAGGAALGVATPAVAEGGAKLVGRAVDAWKRPPPMTQPQIKAASQSAYRAAESAGVVVKPDAFKQFVDDLPGQLDGYRPRIAPKAESVIAEMQADVAAGKPVTLELLDELRQVASGASKTMDRNEVRLISSIVEKLDDFIDSLTPQQLLQGDVRVAGKALKEARSLWRTNAKLRNIDDIIEIGENLNDPNWTKNQFRAIVRKPKLINQYTPQEKAIIKQLARTGSMETLARMTPLRGVQMAAPHIAQVGQDRSAAALQDLIARGGSLPASSGLPPAVFQGISTNAVPVASPLSSMIGGSNQKPYRDR